MLDTGHMGRVVGAGGTARTARLTLVCRLAAEPASGEGSTVGSEPVYWDVQTDSDFEPT